MIESLADLLVVSDMDNTLLTAKEGVPSCNRVTIQLFCELGGRFTVATGRPVESVVKSFILFFQPFRLDFIQIIVAFQYARQ